jgi:hypothetical protein
LGKVYGTVRVRVNVSVRVRVWDRVRARIRVRVRDRVRDHLRRLQELLGPIRSDDEVALGYNKVSVVVFLYWLSRSFPTWEYVFASVRDVLNGETPVKGFLVVENFAHVFLHKFCIPWVVRRLCQRRHGCLLELL